MLRPLLLTASALALSSPASAQVYDASDSLTENSEGSDPEIVVTARLPEAPGTAAYSTVEIERDTILTAPSGRIEDVLGSVAGFQQFRRSDSRSSNPSAQGVTLRALGGNATSRALVLLDGVPIADPFFGYIPLSSIMPESLQAIRVTRGGGSGPFGAGALAGTIELDSVDYRPGSPVTAGFLANQRGETEASALGSARLGAGFVTATGRWDRGKGFFTTPLDQRVPATARAAFESFSGSIRAVTPIAPTIDLQARIAAFDDRRTLRFEGADSSSEGQDASLRLVGHGLWQFDALAYVQSRNFSNEVISSTRFVRVLDQRNTPSTGIGGKFELRPPMGEGKVLRLGVDYRRASGELQEEAYSAFTQALRERRRAGGATSDLGFFAEHDWTLGRLVLTGGLRADHTRVTGGLYRAVDPQGDLVSEVIADDRSDWSVTYRAGARLGLGEALSVRGAAYSGIRLPTLNELYRPFVVFPVVTEANAELRNERLEGFEIGLDFQPSEGLNLALTTFDNRVENAIANVTLEPNLRQRQNLPAIDARGLEFEAGIESGDWRFNGSLIYTDAEVDGSSASLALDGNRPPQVPRFSAFARMSWEPAKGWLAAFSLRHVGKQFESDQESDVLPAATTLGAYFAAPLGAKLQLVVRAENITDEEVVTRNSRGATDLGAPRTLWAGMRYGF
ncbi:TonB-dependent receptor [Altererythrobacter sp. MF3-039]|uniref:TonB-dependent receptor n=1 Tax=Altererythrobacter sp. MF3-039 TaxID=3252901 RepID=UPI00390CD55F